MSRTCAGLSRWPLSMRVLYGGRCGLCLTLCICVAQMAIGCAWAPLVVVFFSACVVLSRLYEVLLYPCLIEKCVCLMIYDIETALYRRFVQCVTPVFDRQRAARIFQQRLMQYGHRMTRQCHKDPNEIADSLVRDGMDPDSVVTRGVLLCIAGAFRCRFCQGGERVSLRACAGCMLARYCSRECQLADWSDHCEVCEPLDDDRISGARSSNR